MPGDALSSVDRVWLRMEDPIQPMMITILLIFDAPVEFEQLQTIFRQRLLPFARFRQRVLQPRGSRDSAFWEDSPSVDLDHHLKRSSLSIPGDEEALRSVVSELMGNQLDFSKPLWQFHLIESYGSGCALVGRMHHCLADGPALMNVLLALTDSEPNMSAPGVMVQAVPCPSPTVPNVTAQLTELLVQQGLGVLSNPTRIWNLIRLGTDTMAVMSKILWRSPDGGTILRGNLTAEKRVAWSRPVALAEVKAIGRAVGGTVNDVMLAAATGGLRHYLQSHGEPVGGLAIRAGLSVNLRAPDAAPSLSNQAGAVLVDLPVGLDGSLARLQQVKRTMDEIKSSPEAGVVWRLLNALGKAPAEVQDVLVKTYLSRDTAVIANVPGPGETVYLAGAPLSSLMFWVPALGGAGLCLSIASYAGQAWFGIATDQNLVPDPEEIVAGFHTELEALQRSTQEVASDRDKLAVREDTFEAMNDSPEKRSELSDHLTTETRRTQSFEKI